MAAVSGDADQISSALGHLSASFGDKTGDSPAPDFPASLKAVMELSGKVKSVDCKSLPSALNATSRTFIAISVQALDLERGVKVLVALTAILRSVSSLVPIATQDVLRGVRSPARMLIVALARAIESVNKHSFAVSVPEGDISVAKVVGEALHAAGNVAADILLLPDPSATISAHLRAL